jgi:ferredoxin-like protein FixX
VAQKPKAGCVAPTMAPGNTTDPTYIWVNNELYIISRAECAQCGPCRVLSPWRIVSQLQHVLGEEFLDFFLFGY